MHKTGILVLFFFALTGGCLAQSTGKFVLNARLPANSTGMAYLSYRNEAGLDQQDSSMVKEGRFSFSGKIAHPTFARLFFDRTEREIFLEPSVITVVADSSDPGRARITGSITQTEYEKLDRAVSKIRSRWKIVMDTLSAINKRSNTLYQEYKEWVLSPYFEEMRETYLGFFDSHPSSYVTAWSLMIEGRDLTTDSLRLFYGRFSNAVKQSFYGKNIFRQLEDRKIGVPGATAANFTVPDLQGNKLELAQFKGKYVLLDFWGSWCLPCRKSHPHLKTLYSKYREQGIEFIGVAREYNNNMEAWRKAIQEDQLDWPQVMTIDTPEGNIIHKYNISYYPTKILIDKNGVIVGRYGEKEMGQLDSMLESIFKNQ